MKPRTIEIKVPATEEFRTGKALLNRAIKDLGVWGGSSYRHHPDDEGDVLAEFDPLTVVGDVAGVIKWLDALGCEWTITVSGWADAVEHQRNHQHRRDDEGDMTRVIVRDYASHGEPDRATVRANNVVVDVIADDDGSVTIETYPYEQADPRLAVTVEHQRTTSTGEVITLVITEQ